MSKTHGPQADQAIVEQAQADKITRTVESAEHLNQLESRFGPRKHWVCSKCYKDLNPSSIRTRFGNEKCPLCEDPGSGMGFVIRSIKFLPGPADPEPLYTRAEHYGPRHCVACVAETKKVD